MLKFMADVRSSQIVINSFCIIFYFNFLFCAVFVLTFYELFFKLIEAKWLNKWIELLFLIITGRFPGVNEDIWTDHSSENLRLLWLVLLDVDGNEKMKVLPLVIVARRREFHGTEIDLAIHHFHFAFSPHAYILKDQFLWTIIVVILLDCKNMGLDYE